MKCLSIKTLLLCTSVFSGNLWAQQDQSVGVLSDEDLKPFCSNEMLWKSKGISTGRCIVAARLCAQENAKKALNAIEATQALYRCTFKKLDVEIDFNFDPNDSDI